MIDLEALLRAAMPRGPSDFHLRAGWPPVLRVRNRLAPLAEWPRLRAEDVEDLVRRLLPDEQRARLARDGGVSLPMGVPELGRFRVTVHRTRGAPAVAVRVLAREAPVLEALNLPAAVARLAMERRGLVLVTGPAGAGKSTTLAAMINLMNETRNDHIVTIEDPIEYVFESRGCLITQREIGADVPGWDVALRLVLRQDPNVIVIGEMRDEETFRTVLTLAQTGHLVLSTLHTGSAVETVHRIVAMLPEQQEASVRAQLAHVLRGLVCQRLVERADGGGLLPVTEVLVATSSVFRAIMEPGLTARLPTILARGRDLFGMQTFDQCALDYYLRGWITEATARQACGSPVDFDVALRRAQHEQRVADAGTQEGRARDARNEAVVVFEVVGVTDLLVSQGDASVRAFMGRIAKRLAAMSKQFRAHVVEEHLEGFLIAFPNVDWALLALRTIFARLAEFSDLGEPPVAFRGALHYGSTWIDPQSNRVGAVVHKAFRVCRAIDTPDLWGPIRPKEANVVLATEEAHAMLVPSSARARPLGAVPLKGFAGVHPLYELAVAPGEA